MAADDQPDTLVPELDQVARAQISALRIVGEHGLEIGRVIAPHQADDGHIFRECLELRAILAGRHHDQSVDAVVDQRGEGIALLLRIVATDAQKHLITQRLEARLHHFGHHLERGVGEIVDEKCNESRLPGLEAPCDRVRPIAELACDAHQALLRALTGQAGSRQRSGSSAD